MVTATKRRVSDNSKKSANSEPPHIAAMDEAELRERLLITYRRQEDGRRMNEVERTFCQLVKLGSHPLLEKERQKAVAILLKYDPQAEEGTNSFTSAVEARLPKVPHSVSDLGLERLKRHPLNRVPTPEDVAEKVSSMALKGQLEAIVVRPQGDRYEILSGETRWLAAQELEWDTIKARVVVCDDAHALMLLADFNANRKDLNPIQQAKLIMQLCKPTDKGGAGLTREAAGQRVGVSTGAAASNLVRLLELPKQWQERVASGALPQSIARLITPYVGIAKFMEDLEADYSSQYQWERERFASREAFEESLPRAIDECAYALDKTGEWWDMPDGMSGHYPCLLTKEDIEQHRDRLGIMTIPVPDGKKMVEKLVATNVELFKKLQEQRIREKHVAKGKKQAAAAGKSADGGEHEQPKSKAELAAAAKQRAEQLARNIAAWKERFMRTEIAEKINTAKITEKLETRLLQLFLHHFITHDASQIDLESVVFGKRAMNRQSHYERLAGTVEVGLQISVKAVCAHLMSHEGYGRPTFSPETLDAIFADWGCDLSHAWQRGWSAKNAMIEEYFQMHRKAELIDLAKELGVHLTESQGKPDMIRILLNRSAPLPLPKCLASAKRQTKKGGK